MGYYVKLVLGLALCAAAYAIGIYAFVKLIETGTCASGNTPYAIARQCPAGTGKFVVAIPVAIFAGLAGFGIYAARGDRPGGQLFEDPTISFPSVAWMLLFCGIGIACLWVRFIANEPLQAGAKFTTIFLPALFIPMGLAPIGFALWVDRGDRRRTARSAASPYSTPPSAPPKPFKAAGPVVFTGGRVVSGSPMGGSDSVDQLERLDKLRRDGALTQSEFETEKAKLLGEG